MHGFDLVDGPLRLFFLHKNLKQRLRQILDTMMSIEYPNSMVSQVCSELRGVERPFSNMLECFNCPSLKVVVELLPQQAILYIVFSV